MNQTIRKISCNEFKLSYNAINRLGNKEGMISVCVDEKVVLSKMPLAIWEAR
jgi:hypothetical protein